MSEIIGAGAFPTPETGTSEAGVLLLGSWDLGLAPVADDDAVGPSSGSSGSEEDGDLRLAIAD